MFDPRPGGASRAPGHAGFGLLVACALLAAIGAAILDDYGVSIDEGQQRWIAEINWRHALGEVGLRFGDDTPYDRFYGVAFELPLLLAEKALGLDDSRRVYLLRHAASHLLFLVGALCCALLVRRVTGSSIAALFALALFVLQPRIYAHSFFNSKDIPALALFSVCLYLIHWAFRSGGAAAFLLCGAGVAVLTNLRIPAGLVLVTAVAGLRGLDLTLASGSAARRRVLSSLTVFAAGWAGALYAISPYMWADGPAAFIDAVTAFARHPNRTGVLFQGQIFPPSNLPPHYFPVWFAVSTPPVLLALGLAGFAIALRQGFVRPGKALRDTRARFALAVAACWAGPPLAAALFDAHAYDGWRHMFFIHAPFCVLAAVGAAALARAARRMTGGGGKVALRALAGAGTVAAATGAVLLHPHQQVYFNGLEDRTTPWRIRERYDFGYWGPTFRAGLERALAERPGADLRLCGSLSSGDELRNVAILRAENRARVVLDGDIGACEAVLSHPLQRIWEGRPSAKPIVPPTWSLAAYGSSFLDAFDMDAIRAARRRMEVPVPARPPDVVAAFDVWIRDGRLIYARNGCAPEDLAARFFLHIDPVDPADLPGDRRRYGFDNRDFSPRETDPFWPSPTATRRDGRCLILAPLPDYPIRRVRTGQMVYNSGGWRRLWEGGIDLVGAPRRAVGVESPSSPRERD